MKMNGGFLVTKIKQLGDRIFEKILSEKNIDAFNGAQGRILYVLWHGGSIVDYVCDEPCPIEKPSRIKVTSTEPSQQDRLRSIMESM